MLIQSRQNPLIKKLAKLASDGRARRSEGLLLAEGIHLVRDAIACGAGVEQVVHTPQVEQNPEAEEILQEAQACGIETIPVTKECYQRFSALKSPEGIAAIIAFTPVKPEILFEPPVRLVILSGIQDPGNAGAVLRTAEAVGASGAIFCSGVDPTHPAFVRAAMGASFRLKSAIDEVNELTHRCRQHGVRLLVSTLEGETSYLKA
ncbi:MAG: hypothetical protein JXA52_09285, partial [Planctomycetes bacterium]|nr:hypothetical protein [Planctomycetota bacterium]